MSEISSTSNWERLFRVACALIRQVNSRETVIDNWTFGGGTALMLQIGHRESRDVDIFLADPQLLAFLDPETRDFEFEIRPTDYKRDGSRFLKLAFQGIGEIDFIVANSLTSAPMSLETIEDQQVQLESVPEIIAKKIYYRGASIRPRDIFDIAAAGDKYADAIRAGLKIYRNEVGRTLSAIEKLNRDFVDQAIAELAIKPEYKTLVRTALDKAKEILTAV